MKASLRDHLTVLLAFAAIFLCGFAIGKLPGKRSGSAAVASTWEAESLSVLKRSLPLTAAEEAIVEEEIANTAAQIQATRAATMLAYHQHLNELYQRLIKRLDEPSGSKLKAEKQELEKQIETLEGLGNIDLKPTKP